MCAVGPIPLAENGPVAYCIALQLLLEEEVYGDGAVEL